MSITIITMCIKKYKRILIIDAADITKAYNIK